MGLHSDTYEDALERQGFLEWDNHWAPRVDRVAAAPRAPSFACNACGAEFAVENARLDHLFAKHPLTKFYVRVNERIAPEVLYLDEPLQQLEVVPIGPSDLNVTVKWVNSEPATVSVSAGRVIDLTTRFGNVTEPGEVRLWAKAGGREHVYRIYVHEVPALDHETLDAMVFEAQLPLTDHRESGWRALRDSGFRESGLGGDYLLGFASYLHACDLEAVGDFGHARTSLEAAFALLRPFATQLARDARGALAFRMHAMAMLRARGTSSIFWQAANYFEVPAKMVPPAPLRLTEHGIWLDDFQEGILRSVALSNEQEWPKVDETLKGLPANLAREPGNELKMIVLSARCAWAQGAKDKARSAYVALRADPVYRVEAGSRS